MKLKTLTKQITTHALTAVMAITMLLFPANVSAASKKAQKKAMPGKEKKPSIHERLEINKRIIREKHGKDKPERGADLGVRTV